MLYNAQTEDRRVSVLIPTLNWSDIYAGLVSGWEQRNGQVIFSEAFGRICAKVLRSDVLLDIIVLPGTHM